MLLVQSMIMSLMPCISLINVPGRLWGKNPSLGLRFKRQNIVFIETIHATKVLCMVLSSLCNICI